MDNSIALKTKKMNCKTIKEKVGIRTVLESFGKFPAKKHSKTAFYFALDREEEKPSLSVDFEKNVAFDFGTGKSYDVISIVQQIKKCSVSDALKYLSQFIDFYKLPVKKIIKEKSENYRIIKIQEIRHPALIDYLKSRKVLEQKDLVNENHYQLGGKEGFGIGFKNNSQGFEIRNSYSKICLGKKDISFIQTETGHKEIALFEGFFDYLTFRNLEEDNTTSCDYLVLNSTVMFFKAEEILRKYDKILLFLDNDNNGVTLKTKIKNLYPDVEDCSLIYHDCKDLNEWGQL